MLFYLRFHHKIATLESYPQVHFGRVSLEKAMTGCIQYPLVAFYGQFQSNSEHQTAAVAIKTFFSISVGKMRRMISVAHFCVFQTLIFSILPVVGATLITSHSLLGYDQVYNCEGSSIKYVMARKKISMSPRNSPIIGPRLKKIQVQKLHDQFKKLSSVIRVIGPRKNIFDS